MKSNIKFIAFISMLIFSLFIYTFVYNSQSPIFANEEIDVHSDIEIEAGEEYVQGETWINSYGNPEFNDDKIRVLGDIQDGTGKLMQEIARRFTALFYSARGGNWDLANYQLKEMREAIEKLTITRPGRKEKLDSFDDSFLGDEEDPAPGTLLEAINNKDFRAFNRSFKGATQGCNSCHQSTGHGFIKYKLPKRSVIPTQFTPVK